MATTASAGMAAASRVAAAASTKSAASRITSAPAIAGRIAVIVQAAIGVIGVIVIAVGERRSPHYRAEHPENGRWADTRTTVIMTSNPGACAHVGNHCSRSDYRRPGEAYRRRRGEVACGKHEEDAGERSGNGGLSGTKT